nr:uncharacterized protein LOC129383545 isoform X2 [Dermacentor andersoni]
MAIYPEPPIGNLTLLHAIAYARQQKGLHIYFDEPPAKALSLSTPIQQIQKCNCSDMNITFVLRALEDKPQYIVGIEDDKDTTAMEAGVGGPSFCFMGRAKDGTWKDNDCSQEAFVAKKDDFLTTKFLISNKDGFGKGISQVACEQNGIPMRWYSFVTSTAEEFRNVYCAFTARSKYVFHVLWRLRCHERPLQDREPPN